MKPKTWKVTVVPALAALVAGAAVAATAANERKATSASSQLTGEISVLYSSDFMFNSVELTNRFWNGIKKQFESSYPGATLKLVGVPGNAADVANTAALRFKSKSTAPDVLEFNTAFTPQFAASGYLMPLNGFLSSAKNAPFWKNFPANVKALGTVGKNVYSLSIGSNISGIFYNKAMLRKAGIALPWNPKSWTEILTAAQKVKKSNPGVIPLWLAAGVTGGPGVVLQGTGNLIYGSQTPVMLDPKTKKWVVDSPGLRAVFSFYKNVYGGGLGPSLSYVFRTDSVAQPPTLFPARKLAIAMGANWYPTVWVDKNGSAPWSAAPKEVGIAPIPTRLGQAPGRVSALGGWAVAVSKTTEKRDLALALVKMLESPTNLLHTALWSGYVPPDTNVGQLKAFTSYAPPFMAAFNTYTKYGRALPLDPDYPVYIRALGTATGQIAQKPSTSIDDAIKLLRDGVAQQLGSDKTTTLP